MHVEGAKGALACRKEMSCPVFLFAVTCTCTCLHMYVNMMAAGHETRVTFNTGPCAIAERNTYYESCATLAEISVGVQAVLCCGCAQTWASLEI